jgi:hypothetical protein
VRRSDLRRPPPGGWRFVLHGVLLGAGSGVVIAVGVALAFSAGLTIVGAGADVPLRPVQVLPAGGLGGAAGGAALAVLLLPYRWSGPSASVRAIAAGWAGATAVATGLVQLARLDAVTLRGTTVLLLAAAALAAVAWATLVPLLWWRRRTSVAPTPSERPRRSDRHVRR